MVGAKTDDARKQVAAMDRHIEASLARLDQSATWPIVWYRGPIFGLRQCAIYDMAVGSEVGSYYQRGDDGLTELDRHEVAHCVITRFYTAKSDPPRVLMEGWAQANQGTSAEDLADTAWNDRQRGLNLPLRKLVAPDWYWYSGPTAYNQGAPLVNYLLRVYGPERFLKLYTTCRQETFESDLRACLGIDLDDLDAAYWADVERLVRTGPPARRWLKGLKLASNIDLAAWNAFLDQYFTAATRLVAPYQHVRLSARFRSESKVKDRDESSGYEKRLTLLRSGPFAHSRELLLGRHGGSEWVTLVHPDHTLNASHQIHPEIEPWMIQENSWTDPLQVYRQAMDRIEFAPSTFFVATHGGAALLEYPQNLKESRSSTSLEVAKLQTQNDDGRRLVTLRLRTNPEVKSGNRFDATFDFDADDLFVVRSIRYEDPERKSISDVHFEYDHVDGHPMLRSAMMKSPSQRTVQLDVRECRFGPISESEFAIDPFLSSLGPDRIGRRPEFELSTTTWLEWYWLAIALGAVHMVIGSVMALKDRHHDRLVQPID
jgi:hypothetical protein